MPKGHPAILYDEKAEHVFGAKDAVIIGIVNEKGIFNPKTLELIKRVTEKIAALDGVIANRTIDVASLSTISIFSGTETELINRRVMEQVPTDAAGIEALKKLVYDNKDLLVGNVVSADGKAAMIRAKLKEGITTRYATYFQIKHGIIAAETGQGGWGGGNWPQGNWNKSDSADSKTVPPSNTESSNNEKTTTESWQQGQWGEQNNNWQQGEVSFVTPDGDHFYLAGRPVIEVSSGLYALQDMYIMIPLLFLAMMAALFGIFRTLRGVVLPLFVVAGAIIWTMGAMAVAGVPLYTISTMLPVILVAVGIGDAIHILSRYYDVVFTDPYRDSKSIVVEVMQNLHLPVMMTSVTTAIGFLSLLFAEMPPFKVFGVFTVVGILFSWLLSITFLPASLVLLKPKVGRYLAKRRSMRIQAEQNGLARGLVKVGDFLLANRNAATAALLIIAALALYGSSRLYVDSSWMSDFREDSEVAQSNKLLNEKFAGTVFLNVVIEGKEPNAIKSPQLLQAMNRLQERIEGMPYVGDSLSVVDYLKSMNKNVNGGRAEFEILPTAADQIAEYLFLFSVSGRPEQLDEVVDFDYRRANITFSIKTDHTKPLETIINEVRTIAAKELTPLKVDVNLAGSANNSYIWADMLIQSQLVSIIFSKIGIFLIAALLFRSLLMGFIVVIPVTLTTLFIGGVAGFAGLPIDVSTTLAAGVAIGVGVDYAIHYLVYYRRELANSGNHRLATLDTLRGVGKTIVFNATVVTLGFAVLFFSMFPPHVKLGYFVAAYMVVSCLVALWVLPLVLSFFKPKLQAG